MKRIILMLTILIAAATIIAPVMAPCEPLSISKRLVCSTGEGYSDNPPYYVGDKYYFWMEIRVDAYVNLEDVVVYDRLGAELMIEGIFDNEADKIANRNPPWNYNFEFDYNPYARDGEVLVNAALEGYLDKDGVQFDDFTVFWTGKSVKVHFMWDVGDMSAGETRMIWLVVSTDTNPAGHQEYTSPGCYELNSGATVKAIVESTGKQFSATTPSIQIGVSWPPD